MKSVNTWYEPERRLDPPEQKSYYCPTCGAENPEHYYRNWFGRIVGCDKCVDTLDAAQWEGDHR